MSGATEACRGSTQLSDEVVVATKFNGDLFELGFTMRVGEGITRAQVCSNKLLMTFFNVSPVCLKSGPVKDSYNIC